MKKNSGGENILIGVLIAVASVGALACFIVGGIAFFSGRGETAAQPSPIQTAQATAPPSAPSAGVGESDEPQNTDDPVQSERNEDYTLDLDTIAAIWRISLAENFGENNYELEYDDTGMTINVWGDGVALDAASAALGDEDAKEAWAVLVDSQKTLCVTILEQVEDLGIENYYVVLNVLNDMDKSKTLLSTLNGTVVYDAVNG